MQINGKIFKNHKNKNSHILNKENLFIKNIKKENKKNINKSKKEKNIKNKNTLDIKIKNESDNNKITHSKNNDRILISNKNESPKIINGKSYENIGEDGHKNEKNNLFNNYKTIINSFQNNKLKNCKKHIDFDDLNHSPKNKSIKRRTEELKQKKNKYRIETIFKYPVKFINNKINFNNFFFK